MKWEFHLQEEDLTFWKSAGECNKRMAVPEELLPAFCRIISAKGTRKSMYGYKYDTINAFVREKPSVSMYSTSNL